MTREEAIKVLRTESVELGGNAVSVARWMTALDVAIKALDDVTDKDVGKNEPLTNAQKIRAMNDEELAEFIKHIKIRAAFCKAVKDNDAFEELCSAEWLQQPAGEEDKHESN